MSMQAGQVVASPLSLAAIDPNHTDDNWTNMPVQIRTDSASNTFLWHPSRCQAESYMGPLRRRGKEAASLTNIGAPSEEAHDADQNALSGNRSQNDIQLAVDGW